jgi:hypothetical protein
MYAVYIFMSTMKYRASGWLLYCSKWPMFALFNLKNSIPLFGNRLHITGTKINRQILNTNVNK